MVTTESREKKVKQKKGITMNGKGMKKEKKNPSIFILFM